jgi:tRNA pseudouridine55 synthase
MDGFAIVDKDAGWTSHDVVAKARGILRERRIGHSGTLDPDATGVLLLGIGRGTRLLQFLGDLPKTYVGEVVLGTATSTLDASGEVVATFDMSAVTDADVAAAAARFVGEIDQVPPMVSAVKVGGKRLHELARQGIEVERKARRVTIHALSVAPVEAGVHRVEVTCSSGTYIRTLAADIGLALGGGAHLRNLRRTAIGPFTLADARPLEAIEVLPMVTAVRELASVVVDDEVALAVAHGRVLPETRLGVSGAGPWAVLGADGALLAVYEPHRAGDAKPRVVLVPSSGS